MLTRSTHDPLPAAAPTAHADDAGASWSAADRAADVPAPPSPTARRPSPRPPRSGTGGFRARAKALALATTAALIALAGCSAAEPKRPAIPLDAPVALKVVYFSDDMFHQMYGNLFLSKYPNVEFDIVPTMTLYGENKDPAEEYKKLVEEHRPDVLVMDEGQYEALAAAGRLYGLEPLMKESDFALDELTEGVAERLKHLGGGGLYGLAPFFAAQALYYNRDLFERHGVPTPTDGMTWEEVFALAARFPTDGDADARVYGLAQSVFAMDPFQLVKSVAASKELSYLSPDGSTLTLDGVGWREAFRLVADAYRSGAVAMPEPPQAAGEGVTFVVGDNSDPFLSGRAAMLIDGLQTLNFLKMKGVSTGADAPPDIGVVTIPVDPLHPETNPTFALSQIFGIAADSPNAAAAWEFIRYIHSKEFADIRSKSSTELLSREGYAVDRNGFDLRPFYALRPGKAQESALLPKGFPSAFHAAAAEELQAAVQGDKTADEAFDSFAKRAARALEEANRSGEKEWVGRFAGGVSVSPMFVE